MNIIRDIAGLAQVPGPVFLALGVFDGLHLGHRAVILRAMEDAAEAGGSAAAVTFDPHPQRVLRPELAPRLLTSTAHKVRLLRGIGLEHLLLIGFDRAFASTPPEEFVRGLAAACRPLRGLCVGHEWGFGKGRSGNVELLRRMGADLGFAVDGVPPVQIEGQTISSTFIRSLVEAGELDLAGRLLGRPFSLLGTVEHGQHVGRELGFPTANLTTGSEQFPPDGVYAVEAEVAGTTRPGVLNIGLRPTFEGSRRVVEVHLFDFAGDLYGLELEVFFRRFLRGEQKFESAQALKEQIARDVALARAVLPQAIRPR